MRTEPFDFAGFQGRRLSGVLDLPDEAPRAVAVFAHCFTCTKSSVAAVRVPRALTRKGFAVLRFDFAGLGRSEGDFADTTFSADVCDLVTAGATLSARGMAPELLVGHSLGGAAVLAAALQMHSVRAVATIGAPYDAAHVSHLLTGSLDELRAHGEAEVQIAGRHFKLRRTFLDDLEQHDQKARIRCLRRALLVIHAVRDKIVALDNARAIFEAAMHPKSFVALDGADHLLTRSADAEYVADVIATWASRYLGAAAPAQRPPQIVAPA